MLGYRPTAHRMFMLEGENAVDPEEERMREAGCLPSVSGSEIRNGKACGQAKAQEEARKRDKERLAKAGWGTVLRLPGDCVMGRCDVSHDLSH